jgi:hypothetical protein
MFVETKELVPALRAALESVRYGAKDIRLEAAERIDSYSEGNAGTRGFVIAVNLDTGERKSMIGSWGGGNMFTSTLVDAGSEMAELPANGAVIKGTMGYPRTYAAIYAHPNALGRFLPAGEDDRDELTAEELQALYCFVCIKGGEYRREELRRRSVSDSTVDGLVSRGYLKRNRAGATSVTTAGKNASTVRY